jgi:hypothetical protein
VCFRCLDERFKQAKMLGAVRERFWMPLNAQSKRIVTKLARFYDAVLGPSHCRDPFPYVLDCLVMRAVRQYLSRSK